MLLSVWASRWSMTSDSTSCKSSIEIGDPAVAVSDGLKGPRYVTRDWGVGPICTEDGAIVWLDEGCSGRGRDDGVRRNQSCDCLGTGSIWAPVAEPAATSRVSGVGPPAATPTSATALSAATLTPAVDPPTILVPALISAIAFTRALVSAILRCRCSQLSASVQGGPRHKHFEI